MTDRIDLNVPFAHKDAARAAGARWDAARRVWYYPGATLPAMLEQFAAPGAAPDSALLAEVSTGVAALIAALPTDYAARRAAMIERLPALTDPLLIIAARAILDAPSAEVIDAATTDVLTTIYGQSVRLPSAVAVGSLDDVLRTLTPRSLRPAEALDWLRRTTAGQLIHKQLAHIGKIATDAERARAKQAAIDTAAALLARIDLSGVDFDADSIMVDGHQIDIGIANNAWITIEAIDGKRQIDSCYGDFAAWPHHHQAEFTDSLSALTAEFTRREQIRAAKLATFEVASATIKGSDISITSTDGRLARGCRDAGEWLIYEVAGKSLPSKFCDKRILAAALAVSQRGAAAL